MVGKEGYYESFGWFGVWVLILLMELFRFLPPPFRFSLSSVTEVYQMLISAFHLSLSGVFNHFLLCHLYKGSVHVYLFPSGRCLPFSLSNVRIGCDRIDFLPLRIQFFSIILSSSRSCFAYRGWT